MPLFRAGTKSEEIRERLEKFDAATEQIGDKLQAAEEKLQELHEAKALSSATGEKAPTSEEIRKAREVRDELKTEMEARQNARTKIRAEIGAVDKKERLEQIEKEFKDSLENGVKPALQKMAKIEAAASELIKQLGEYDSAVHKVKSRYSATGSSPRTEGVVDVLSKQLETIRNRLRSPNGLDAKFQADELSRELNRLKAAIEDAPDRWRAEAKSSVEQRY